MLVRRQGFDRMEDTFVPSYSCVTVPSPVTVASSTGRASHGTDLPVWEESGRSREASSPPRTVNIGEFRQMNQEREVGKSDQTDISPLVKLEAAIQDYMDSMQDTEREGASGGMLTGWVLLTEEQHIVSGKSCLTRVIKDHQSFTTTLGLVSYADKFYSAKVANG